MRYEKPEIAVVGDATVVIRGTRNVSIPEADGKFQLPSDAELDD